MIKSQSNLFGDFLQDDTAVSDGAAKAFGMDDQRVDVQLGDFRVLGDQDGEAGKRIFQSRKVVLTQTAVVVHQLVDLRVFQHAVQEVFARRSKTELNVFHEFRRRAAHTEHDQRTEFRVAVASEDDFRAFRGHFFDQDAVDLRARNVFRDVGVDLFETGFRAFRTFDVEENSARVELVFDVSGHDLHDDGGVPFANGLGSIFCRGDDRALQERQAVAGEDLTAFRLSEVFAVRIAEFFSDDLGALRFVGAFDADRGAVGEFGLFGKSVGCAESADGIFREAVVRDTAVTQALNAFRDHFSAHEAGDDRNVEVFGDLRDDLADLVDVRHGLRGQDDQTHVDAGIFEDFFAGGFVAVVLRVTDHVDRVAEGSGSRKLFAEGVFRGVRDRREGQAVAFGSVGRHDAGAAGVGDDGETIAARHRLVAVQSGVVEQLGDRINALDAGLHEQCLVDRVVTGKRTGVAGDGFRARGGTAGFQHEDRLFLFVEDLRGDFLEFRTAGDGFQIHRDHFRVRVVGQVVEQVDLVDVGFVSERNEFAEAHVAFFGKVKDRGAERAGLADEGEGAGFRGLRGERGVHFRVVFSIQDTEAVRTDEAHALFVDQFDELFFKFGTGGVDFFETGGNADEGFDAFFGAFFGRLKDEFARNDDDCEVHITGNVFDGGVGFDSQHFRGFRVDRVDRAAFEGVQQVLQNVVSAGLRLRGSSNNRDGFRIEQRVKFANVCHMSAP